MYFIGENYLLDHVDEVLELVDSDEVTVTLDSSENVVLVKESTWRSLQEIAHLFATTVNSDRLQKSLQQVDSESLTEAALE